MSLRGIELLTSVVIVLGVVPASEADLLALIVKSILCVRLLIIPASLWIKGMVRPHIVLLDVGLKLPLELRFRGFDAVLSKLFTSTILLFHGSLNGFSISSALSVQEAKR